jgi:hypothetical protein
LGLPLYSRSTSGFQEVAPCIFSIHAGSPLFTTVALCPWLYQRLSIVYAMVYTVVNHGTPVSISVHGILSTTCFRGALDALYWLTSGIPSCPQAPNGSERPPAHTRNDGGVRWTPPEGGTLGYFWIKNHLGRPLCDTQVTRVTPSHHCHR